MKNSDQSLMAWAIALALAVLGAALRLDVDSGTNESRPS
jgi:hypothetical protein